MRVLAVLNSINPATLDRAGGVVHFLEVARRWTDVELIVLAPKSARSLIARELPKARLVETPDYGTQNSALGLLCRGVSAAVHAYKLRFDADVVLALSHGIPDTLPAWAFGRKRAVVTLWHFVGSPLRRPGGFLNNTLAFMNDAAGRFLMSKCCGYIVGSHLLARELHIDNRSFVAVTTNGVQHLAPGADAGARDGALYLGRIHPSKGIEDLIGAWAILARNGVETRLTIVGRCEPEYRSWVENMISRYNLANYVSVRYDVENEERAALLSSSRFFVFPSKEEGWAIAVAEAMACGLPCLTYDLPIFDEVFPKGRIAVRSGDQTAFAHEAGRLSIDDALCTRLSKEARGLASTFTWDAAAETERSLLAAVSQLASSRRNGVR